MVKRLIWVDVRIPYEIVRVIEATWYVVRSLWHDPHWCQDAASAKPSEMRRPRYLGTLLMDKPQFTVLAKKLNTFLALTPKELDGLAEMQSARITVKRGRQLTHEGQSGHKAFVLQSGWACSYKDLSNGKRQIISFPIAGDCVGLRSVLLQTADHSFSALTDAVVSPVEGSHILKCITEFPRLGAALLWAASRDEAMVVEHLVSIGRRSAIERMAHFFMELAERLKSRRVGNRG